MTSFPRPLARRRASGLLLALALLFLGGPALAAPAETAAEPGRALLQALLAVVVVAFGAGGVAAAVTILRALVPGIARAADGTLANAGTGRLALLGLLPLAGVVLLGMAAKNGDPTHQTLYAFLAVLPAGLLSVVGGLALVPDLGARTFPGGTNASPFGRALRGSLLLALAGGTALVPPLFALVGSLLLAAFLGAGLGALFGLGRARAGATPHPGDAPG